MNRMRKIATVLKRTVIVNLYQTSSKSIIGGKKLPFVQTKACSQFYKLRDVTQRMEQPFTVSMIQKGWASSSSWASCPILLYLSYRREAKAKATMR